MLGASWHPLACLQRVASRLEPEEPQPYVGKHISSYPTTSYCDQWPLGVDIHSGRRRKCKSPPAASADLLEPQRLTEHLTHGPSGDEEESEAKRPRSTSTTPKSRRAKDPDEHDRLMGISAVDLSDEENGFGKGN